MAEDDAWLNRGRIPSLDGLRAVAIAMVLLEHARHTAGFPNLGKFDWFATHGLLGVEVFFAISGFLITTLLLRELDRTGGINLGGFYLRRFLRIVPAYACLLAAAAWLQHRGLIALTRGDWTGALTYTMNFQPHPSWELGHLWSLSIEEQFYLLWPPMLALAPRRRRPLLPLAAMALALTSRCLLAWVFQSHSAGIRGWTPCRLDAIAAGCLLAMLAFDPATRTTLNRYVGGKLTGLGLLLALAASVELRRHWGFWDVIAAYSFNALCIAGLLWWAASHGDSVVGRLLNSSPIRLVGTLSYSLYLWQQIFLSSCHAYAWTVFPLNLLLAFCVAGVSYYVIETPFLKFKDRLGARRHGSV